MRTVFSLGNKYDFFDVLDTQENQLGGEKYSLRVFSDDEDIRNHARIVIDRFQLEQLRDALDMELGPKESIKIKLDDMRSK